MESMVIRNDHDYTMHKSKRLIVLLDSVLQNPLYEKECNYLLLKFGLSRKEIVQAFLDYNLDIFSPEGNDIYTSLANRVVLHVHNLLRGSWHIQRQAAVAKFMAASTQKTAVDIGFGVPSQYMRELLDEGNVVLTLADLYDAAFEFAEAMLSYWEPSWQNLIKFQRTDMDTEEFVGAFDTYIFQDSIEHTPDPTSYLLKYVKLSPEHSKFIFSLPIGPLISRHYIAWKTLKEAEKWLNYCGLVVELQEVVTVNPAIDLFAEQLDFDFHNYIVLCSKKGNA